jgi:hypothetical protein
VTDVRDLVGLLQRADWTRLSLSAEVNDGSTVLVLPGKRYRYQTAERLTGCDGGRPWEMYEEDDYRGGSVHWISGPEAPLAHLLCPAWLLECSRLELRGRTRVCGREALDVVMTRRPSLRRGPVSGDGTHGPVEVVVDAESGILLRVADPDVEPEVTELVRADFAPVIEAARFQPPPGSLIAEGFGESFVSALGPVARVGSTAAGLAAGALGAWIRYSPRRRAEPAPPDGVDIESSIAADEPPPDRSPDGPLVSEELLDLLYAGGPTGFAATLHHWMDLGAMAASVPASARRVGLGGLGLLMDAVNAQPTAAHKVSAVRFAGPGRYQIDHAYDAGRLPTTIACDGQRTWLIYSDKITTGPAEPPPGYIGDLADPSWLLRCTLSGGATVTVGNRPAYRITATRRDGSGAALILFPTAIALVDAELGIISRLTSYIGDRPVQRYELRDITTATGDFHPRIPPGLPVSEKPNQHRSR